MPMLNGKVSTRPSASADPVGEDCILIWSLAANVLDK